MSAARSIFLAIAGLLSLIATPVLGVVPVATGNRCSAGDARKIIVDYDVNIDDVVALAYLLKEPSIDIVAVIVTATAFVNPAPGVDNTHKLLQLLGKNNIDVGIGPSYAAYDQGGWPSFCTYQKGVPVDIRSETDALLGLHNQLLAYSPKGYYKSSPEDGTTVGNTTAAAVYAKWADQGVDTVLTLGTMTSLHSFQAENPASYAKLKYLYAMLGAVEVPGNVWSVPGADSSEFNGFLDPHAAKAVLSSSNWESITLVPLDATNQVPMTQVYMDELSQLSTPEGIFVYELTRYVQNTWHAGRNGFLGLDENGEVTEESLMAAYFFWDPLAAVIMVDESYVGFCNATVEVVANDPPDYATDGSIVLAPNGTAVRYACQVSPEQAAGLQDHLAVMLGRDCIENQPMSMLTLFTALSTGECPDGSTVPGATPDPTSDARHSLHQPSRALIGSILAMLFGFAYAM
uniref:Inosine/uridine-preferring nucleoside hydrolase domain-containing protein n=1 Tax=Tetraselmis chuii TaxID=63592 RepID=A0A7S1X8A9_9CHLO